MHDESRHCLSSDDSAKINNWWAYTRKFWREVSERNMCKRGRSPRSHIIPIKLKCYSSASLFIWRKQLAVIPRQFESSVRSISFNIDAVFVLPLILKQISARWSNFIHMWGQWILTVIVAIARMPSRLPSSTNQQNIHTKNKHNMNSHFMLQ